MGLFKNLFGGTTRSINIEGRKIPENHFIDSNVDVNPQLVEKSRSLGRMSDTIIRYIRTVQSGKRSIIIGKDFVVLSREEYEILCQMKKSH